MKINNIREQEALLEHRLPNLGNVKQSSQTWSRFPHYVPEWFLVHAFFFWNIAIRQTDKRTDEPTKMKTSPSPFGGCNKLIFFVYATFIHYVASLCEITGAKCESALDPTNSRNETHINYAWRDQHSHMRWFRLCIEADKGQWLQIIHYNDTMMSAMASQITGVFIVYSTLGLVADQRKNQSPTSLAFFAGNSEVTDEFPTQRPVTRKMFPFDDVIMKYSIYAVLSISRCHFYSNSWKKTPMARIDAEYIMHIFRITGRLCVKFTGDPWIPLTTASDTELWWLLWSAPE